MNLPKFKYIPDKEIRLGENYAQNEKLWVITKGNLIVDSGRVLEQYHYYVVAEMNPVYTPCYVYRGDLLKMTSINHDIVSDYLDNEAILLARDDHKEWSESRFQHQVLMWRLPDKINNIWTWYDERKHD